LEGGAVADDVRAMVQTGPRVMELQSLARPAVGTDEALIRVEACGICGSDIGMYEGSSADPAHRQFPIIRGHEPVGTIEEIGDDLARRHGLAAGDRVAVDPFLRCGTCRFCLTGRGELCTGGAGAHNSYATIPLVVEPGLWGGFASHLYANSQTILYPIPTTMPATYAAMFNVLGGGIKWGVDAAGTTLGSRVAVLGSGQRGIACAVAALAAGAEHVTVTGLAEDRHKLELATELGVQRTVDIAVEDPVDVVLGDSPRGVDVVIDTTPRATQPIRDAVAMVRTGGRIVVAGFKGETVDDFPLDEVTHKEVTIQGVLGTGSEHYRRAIAMLAATNLPLRRLQTHVLSLEEVERGIQILAGEVVGERPLNVVIEMT
jgi:threonine dehydrogenase-like Zn-dependent dehydrogenase